MIIGEEDQRVEYRKWIDYHGYIRFHNDKFMEMCLNFVGGKIFS